MEEIQLNNAIEGEDARPASFFERCSLLSDGDISMGVVDGTYEIEADNFNVSFCIDDNLFEIRNINARGNAGIGSKVVSEVHNFAEEYDLNVIASNVKDTAQGFWRKMGYQEGENEGEFFRV